MFGHKVKDFRGFVTGPHKVCLKCPLGCHIHSQWACLDTKTVKDFRGLVTGLSKVCLKCHLGCHIHSQWTNSHFYMTMRHRNLMLKKKTEFK